MQLEEDRLIESEKYQEIVGQKLELSDKVVNGDLLRFHNPENFTPVDRSQYNYNGSEDDAFLEEEQSEQ
ncbi:hypothetical protein [Peribacillus asahii]|uniref:hypothetical protein n=1 Tax=Peribacillus asahii TaxID=228899 RepID=UPI00207943A9|nr:hypothetical protein [Peribacillus asahii]USK68882.1 hypothetical protein LIS76_15060 [Peribacillus asahii]